MNYQNIELYYLKLLGISMQPNQSRQKKVGREHIALLNQLICLVSISIRHLK